MSVRSRKGKRLSRMDEQARLAAQLQGFSRHLVPFGPGIGHCDTQVAVDSVVCHRLLKRLAPVSESDRLARARQSIAAVLQRDAAHPGYTVPKDPKLRDLHRLTAARLSFWFRDLRPTYRFAPPSGESASSMQGWTAWELKLETESGWEVSPDCIRYAATIAYKHVGLKRLVRERFRSLYPYLSVQDLLGPATGRNGFDCFERMFRMCCTLRASSRMTTVPKDSSTDRVITCEPFWDMVCQLSFMADIRDCARRNIGHDLTMLQDIHKGLCRHASNATIDLRNASNSTWQAMVETIWPPRLVKILNRLRNAHTEYEEGCYHYFRMFSPMGCGLTFDIMTYTLLAMGRCIDPSVQVYGDDIICKVESVDAIIAGVESLGYEVNVDKSFTEGAFRESCGCFHLLGYGDIVCYDGEWAEDLPSYIGLINKLIHIRNAGQVSFELSCILSNAIESMLLHVPRNSVWGSSPEILTSHVTNWDDRVSRSVWSNDYQRVIPMGVTWKKRQEYREVAKATTLRSSILWAGRHVLPSKPTVQNQSYGTDAALGGTLPSVDPTQG